MIFGLVAFILYLWFFVGFDGLFTLLSRLNVYQYATFFSLAVAALFAAVVFDTLIWRSLLQSLDMDIKFRRLLLYNWIGNFVELIIPSATIGGEVARIALSQKDLKNNTGVAAATVIGSRLITTVVYSGGLLVGFMLLLLTHQLPMYLVAPVAVVAVATSAIIAIVLLVAFKASAAQKIINAAMWAVKRIIKNPQKQQTIQEKLEQTLSSFSCVFRTFKNQPRQLIKPAFYAGLAWVFNLAVYLMIFYAFNFMTLSIFDLATVYCIITSVETATAGIPVGAVEVTMVNLFAVYGVPLVVAGAATTVVRLLTFWSQIIVGYSMVEWIGAKSLLQGDLKNTLRLQAPNINPTN